MASLPSSRGAHLHLLLESLVCWAGVHIGTATYSRYLVFKSQEVTGQRLTWKRYLGKGIGVTGVELR